MSLQSVWQDVWKLAISSEEEDRVGGRGCREGLTALGGATLNALQDVSGQVGLWRWWKRIEEREHGDVLFGVA
jgi:hypothetical protein